MSADDPPGGPEERRRMMSATLPRDVPDEEIAGVRDVSFPIVMRGYERAAVDAYVTRVNRIIAELQVSRSPQSAIRHALDQVGEETRGILERAHDTAEDITARSRSQAADRVDSAEREARALVAEAEARVRELERDAEVVDRERARLIEDVRLVAEELNRVAADAALRFPQETDSGAEGEPEAAPGPPVDADDESAPPEPVPETRGEGSEQADTVALDADEVRAEPEQDQRG
jgi:DivIVA domain-containing protein